MKTFDINAGNPKWTNMSPGRATQARDTGARLTQEATVSPINKPVPAQIAGKYLYHDRNFTPVTGKDETEQELECAGGDY